MTAAACGSGWWPVSFDGGFHDIRALDDSQVAQAIHADGIDVLVDLKGYTAGTRTAVMMARPAPVQVSYLGYPARWGATSATT